MTRFREEQYDTKAFRAWVKVQRANHSRSSERSEARLAWAVRQERRALRSEYFKKKATGYTPKTQMRFTLDG